MDVNQRCAGKSKRSFHTREEMIPMGQRSAEHEGFLMSNRDKRRFDTALTKVTGIQQNDLHGKFGGEQSAQFGQALLGQDVFVRPVVAT